MSLSGNLPTDGTSLDLFIDIDPGAGTGQNTLATAHLPSPPGGLAPLDGTRFDAGFAPDALYYVNSVGSLVYVDRVQLPTGAKLASKRFLGSAGLNAGRGVLSGGSNPNQVEVALDNTNTQGITAASVSGAASATTGFELRIPFADLGLPADFRGSLRLAAFLQRSAGAVSNQWLPGLPAGSGDLGLAPDLTVVAGTQFVAVSIGLVGDIDGDGTVGGADLAVLLSNWGPRTASSASIASDLDDSGTIDAGDLAALLGSWGQG
ncbi:MAG: dockerin type I domain-containing protein [Planctomycetota bacterium]